MMLGLAWLVVAAMLTGCESTSDGAENSAGDAQGEATTSAGMEAGYEAEAVPSEITGPIKWLNPVGDISGWAQTATLQAHVGGGTINLHYDKSQIWPARDGVNATPWAIVNVNGQWYAATFEYPASGQMAKPMGVLSQTGGMGDHSRCLRCRPGAPAAGTVRADGQRPGARHQPAERARTQQHMHGHLAVRSGNARLSLRRRLHACAGAFLGERRARRGRPADYFRLAGGT
jgi:hypothetical protein